MTENAEVDRLKRRLKLGGCGTARGAVQSDYGRPDGKRTSDRKLGAGDARRTGR